MLKSKIHRATLTPSVVLPGMRDGSHYEAAIVIDSVLMKEAGISPHEKVEVLNINNGKCFTVKALAGAPRSGIISINGIAAQFSRPGDCVTIYAHSKVSGGNAGHFSPVVLLMDKKNRIAFETTEVKSAA